MNHKLNLKQILQRNKFLEYPYDLNGWMIEYFKKLKLKKRRLKIEKIKRKL
jgi:hypothetical protein